MLSTSVKLKCNANKDELKHPYFQYPNGVNPGDLAPLPIAAVSFLPVDSLAHKILLEIFPLLMGIIIFTFFLISSFFIVYGVIRGLYTDYMLPRRKKVLQKLGKVREDKRRKHFRRIKKTKEASQKDPSKVMTGRESIFEPHLTQKPLPRPLNDSEYSVTEGESSAGEGRPVKKRLSYTTPPVDKNKARPIVHKPLKIPGRPFPVLPDAPLNKTREAGISPKPGPKKKKPKKKIKMPLNEAENFRPVFVFPVPEEIRKAWDEQRQDYQKPIEPETKTKNTGNRKIKNPIESKTRAKNRAEKPIEPETTTGNSESEPETKAKNAGNIQPWIRIGTTKPPRTGTRIGVAARPDNADMENTLDKLKAKREKLREERLAQSVLEGAKSSTKVSPMPDVPETTVSNPPNRLLKAKGKIVTKKESP